MRSRRRENVSNKGRNRGNLHLTIDGDRDGDPHWSRRENMKKEIRTARGAFTH